MKRPDHSMLFNEEGVDTDDEDPANMMFRAGYLWMMSVKLEEGSEDRKILQRAVRSLVRAALRQRKE